MNIGMIGLGAMGMPIAKRLLSAGHALCAFDLSAQASAQAEAAGARICATPGDIAENSEVLFCSLPNAGIIRSVLEEVLSREVLNISVMADLSSIAPESAREFAKLVEPRGIAYMDCPVSGGVGGAEAGTLTIMVGADEQNFNSMRPLLEAIGNNIRHIGPVGAGSGIKMVNNYLLGCNMAAAAEALTLGASIGLSLDTMHDIIKNSSGRSFIIENKVPNFIKDRKFDGGFAVDLEYKDLGLAVETAKRLSMPIPMGSMAVQVFETARAKGYGRQDITALVKIWEELMNIEVK